jgi:hypothetical protein
MERIIWMYGSTGSTESIIFMHLRIPERVASGKGSVGRFVRVLILVDYVEFFLLGICPWKVRFAYKKYVTALCFFQQNCDANLEIDIQVRVGVPAPGIRPW